MHSSSRRFLSVLWGLSLVGVAALAVLMAPSAAQAQTRGRIYFSDEAFPTEGSAKDMAANIKKQEKKEITKSGDGWKVHLLAFMNGPARATELKLAFFDVGGKANEPVNSFDLTSTEKQNTMASQITLEASGGFKAGNRYRVVLLRLNGNKETHLAKGEISLK
jgi:hypothetical protein